MPSASVSIKRTSPDGGAMDTAPHDGLYAAMAEPDSRPALDAGSLTAHVAEATALREGPEGVSAILRAVFQSPDPLPLRDLARLVRLPLPVAGAVRRELETAGLFERGGGVRLTDAGSAFCREVLALSQGAVSPKPMARDHADIPPELEPALRIMTDHIAAGPPVDVTLDQAPCTPETSVRRALAMLEAGAVDGRRIAILGDDDSMSLAIPLVAAALGAAPKAITVFELDEARCRQLREAARDHGFPLEIVAQDLRDPLPAALRGAFDVFETDTPYTLDGMALFVRRGVEALRPEIGLPGFLSYGDLAPGDQIALMRGIADLGLAATRIRPAFNRYAGASILGSAGQLVEMKVAELLAADTGGRFDRPIYTGEVRPRLRRYRCRDCGTQIVVGIAELHATVEQLKVAGCPQCGGTTFRREGLVSRPSE